MSKPKPVEVTVTMPIAWARELAFAAGNLLDTDPDEAREFLGSRRFRLAGAGYARLNAAIRMAAAADADESEEGAES